MSKLRHSNIVLYMGVCAEPPCLLVRLASDCLLALVGDVCLLKRPCCAIGRLHGARLCCGRR